MEELGEKVRVMSQIIYLGFIELEKAYAIVNGEALIQAGTENA